MLFDLSKSAISVRDALLLSTTIICAMSRDGRTIAYMLVGRGRKDGKATSADMHVKTFFAMCRNDDIRD